MSVALTKKLSELGYTLTNGYLRLNKKTDIKLDIGNTYIIRLSYNALHPASNSNILINWNHNTCPSSEYYKIEVNNIMNNLINVTGISYDFDNKLDTHKFWSGWLDIKDMEVLEKC